MTKKKAADKRLWAKVAEVGCMACLQNDIYTTPEIHHCKDYGRNDNSKVFGLCPAHHRPTAGITGVPNRHGDPKEFAEQFGTDAELYKSCMDLIR